VIKPGAGYRNVLECQTRLIGNDNWHARRAVAEANAIAERDCTPLRTTPYARITEILLKRRVVEGPTNLRPY
jgi:hypothetical protein